MFSIFFNKVCCWSFFTSTCRTKMSCLRLSKNLKKCRQISLRKSLSLNSSVNISETVYKRKLPECCVSFQSKQGKELFKEAMNAGFMEIYFVLGQQLQTQHEPAYCGLTSLVVVLNAFNVDPGKRWKGIWRWYHEKTLNSCLPLNSVKTQGISLKELASVATCNYLNSSVVNPFHQDSAAVFRNDIMQSCKSETRAIMVCFSRKTLDQTGDGHFVSIGRYNPKNDLVLILETARFKYPCYWVSLTLLWKAMRTVEENGMNRGYIKLTKATKNEKPIIE